ncbi:class II fructose-bisphosphate aldolase [[Clostridium] scindens]|uniref:class II fructose-bisphosphate aldolase n=1 Tax=Clostridium scindens (strain JCM 10418 / VPI 12708) TaxID=29347 RepID=UPI003A7F36EA
MYTEKPVLDLNRITLIKQAKDIPYVMHGGSGLSDEEYRTAIHNGICKIKYYTYLSLAGGKGVMQYLNDKKIRMQFIFKT